MDEKIGRNDPCYCGSGKKYKKCCIENEAVSLSRSTSVIDFAWASLRKTEGEVIDGHLMPYLQNDLPEELIDLALVDFDPAGIFEGLETEERRATYEQFFIPWLLFNWLPFEDFGVFPFNPDLTIAQNYILFHPNRLNSAQRRFIEAMTKTHYSFYSVQEIEMEKSITLKDILLGTDHVVKEKKGTLFIRKGTIVFARILTIDSQSIFIGLAPFALPPQYYNSILDFKNWLIVENNDKPLDPLALQGFSQDDLVHYFFELIKDYNNRQAPILYNTDGDPIVFTKSYFTLCLPLKEISEKLLPMTLSKNIDEFLCDAKLNRNGEIKKITLPWLKKGNKANKNWENTILGNISIEKNRLILETNSKKRSEKGKQLLYKYLGENIIFEKELIETAKQKLKSQSTNALSYDIDKEQEKLLAVPEIQEQLKQMAKDHWESWFDTKIPALRNQTPREAAKTKEGRERLEALLLEYEYHDAALKNKLDILKADISYLKRELGLL